jgi:hypothetical protein
VHKFTLNTPWLHRVVACVHVFFFGSVVLNSDCYGLMIKSVCAERDGLDSNRSFQLPAANNAWAIVCAHVRGPSEGQSFAGSLHTNTRVRTRTVAIMRIVIVVL